MKSGFINGFDISHYNPDVDFKAQIAKGFKFCFLKATEGVTFTDPTFKNNWLLSSAAGLFTGAYHYFHPAMSAKDQADFFLSTQGSLRPKDLPPVLDWETMDGLRLSVAKAQALEWLGIVENALNRPPIIYMDRDQAESLGDVSDFKKYPLWLAEYALQPKQPTKWQDWSFWQYTDEDGMDLSIYSGDMASLERLAGG